jgi:hypothetical protein
MEKNIQELWRLLLIIILGTAGSMIAGLMVYGGKIFSIMDTSFDYYIAYGFCSSAIFSFYHVRGLSNTISVSMVFGSVLFVGISFIMPILHAAIYSFGVTTAVILLAFLFERKLAYLKHWKFIAVGIIFGELFVLLNLISLVLAGAKDLLPEMFQRNFLDGLWMGFGLGLGVESAESIIHSVELHKEAKMAPVK